MTGRFVWIAALGVAVAILLVRVAGAADWQWSVPVKSVVSDEVQGHPRAFLWVAPDCQRVRAVIVGQHNMLEEGILEHPILRKALKELGFAEVWVSPAFNGVFRFDQGAGEQFNEMMASLAAESGYEELKFAPVVPIGHSAMASYPYHFAAWSPSRTLVAISCKGTWPNYRDANSPPWKDSDLDGVPLLYVNGEYEDAEGRAGKALAFKNANPKAVLTMLADGGGGHFDFHDRVVEYIAMYLRKVAQYRLPSDAPTNAPVQLKAVDLESGWLYDRWHLKEGPRAHAAPVAMYRGDAKEAFWCFDGELAKATVQYNVAQQNKKGQLAGYIQNGQVVPQNPKTHQQVTLQFLPIDDGLTFKLTGTFLDTVPEGRPVTWTGLPKDSPVGHAEGGGTVVISRICGPVIQTSPDTFAIRFYRMGMHNTKRSNDIWLMATQGGDGRYKRAVQQAQLRFPLRNTVGADQQISFLEIPDQPAYTASLKLNATSSAGVPVYYYVLAGPAELEGDTLKFTQIPPRTKYPVKVTVVAWQWGRSIEPKLKSADPVERSFWLIGPNGERPTSEAKAAPVSWEKATATATATATGAARASQSASAQSAAGRQASPNVVRQLLSERFNDESGVKLINGATLGEGVSGLASDKAYSAVVNVGSPVSSPAALLGNAVQTEGLDELTLTLWYRPSAKQAGDATLLNAGALTLIWGKAGWTLRLDPKTEQKAMYWFNAGQQGPIVDWMKPGEWIFLAATWRHGSNEVVFYQGTRQAAVAKASSGTRPEEVGQLRGRGDTDKRPDAIGNRFDTKYDRPLNGQIDNVRIYDRAMDLATLETIREADLRNEPPFQVRQSSSSK